MLRSMFQAMLRGVRRRLTRVSDTPARPALAVSQLEAREVPAVVATFAFGQLSVFGDNLNNTIVQLHPSPERDAIVAAGIKALEGASLGEPNFGKTKDGITYRGFHVLHVPDALKELAIPKGAVITAVNGVPVDDSAKLLRAVQSQLKVAKHPRVLFIDYVLEQAPRVVEYRIM